MHYDQMEVPLGVNELIFEHKVTYRNFYTVFTAINNTGVWVPCRL